MFNKIEFDTIASTSDYAKENYISLPDKTVIIAKHQTKGKGRLGRIWLDNNDALFSIVLKDSLTAGIVRMISLFAAAIIYDLLKEYGQVSIKWPNDILLKQRKVAGILAETVYSNKFECLILGIGINCNTVNFSEDIKDKAISLKMILKKNIDIKKLIDEFLILFEKSYINFLNGSKTYLQVCMAHSAVIGKEIKVVIKGEERIVTAQEILEDGSLLVSEGKIQYPITSGEVTLTKNY